MKKIAVTTGDSDGVGLEITLKSFLRLKPMTHINFFIYLSASESLILPSYDFSKLQSNGWKILIFNELNEAIFYSEKLNKKNYLFFIRSSLSAPDWVIEVTKACLAKKIDGLCTAPMSKTLIRDAGYADHGHTEIFKRICKIKNIQMAFIASKFNVLLMTDHIPVKKISKAITTELLKNTLKNGLLLRKILPSHIRNKPIALLGLNPHAGESGILGDEENIFKSLLKSKKKYPIVGPLVPDVAFQQPNWKKYSFYIACYHDQGLIPFKVVHGQNDGIQISMGLPFVRTSVDHGTAKDIFGKNKANPASMLLALKWCVKLVLQK